MRVEPESPLTDQLDSGIRQRLQRIAAEVSARLIGYEGRKPPPVSAFYAVRKLFGGFSCFVLV